MDQYPKIEFDQFLFLTRLKKSYLTDLAKCIVGFSAVIAGVTNHKIELFWAYLSLIIVVPPLLGALQMVNGYARGVMFHMTDGRLVYFGKAVWSCPVNQVDNFELKTNADGQAESVALRIHGRAERVVLDVSCAKMEAPKLKAIMTDLVRRHPPPATLWP